MLLFLIVGFIILDLVENVKELQMKVDSKSQLSTNIEGMIFFFLVSKFELESESQIQVIHCDVTQKLFLTPDGFHQL